MTSKSLPKFSDKEIDKALVRHKGVRAAARALGVPYSTLWHALKAREKDGAFTDRTVLQRDFITAPKRGVKRFIFTCAQAGAKVHEGFLVNLEAYAHEIGAKILIGGITYNQQINGRGPVPTDFHPLLEPYMTSKQINVGDKLLFCGEINTSPTATQPLSGFETYTRDKWGVFPHPRICLQSVATMFNAPSKIIMTTGCVTKPNYIPRKVGIKAEFHHVIGAVLCEVDAEGDVFCRHLIAEPDGAFQDLTTTVRNGHVNEAGLAVAAITWGDIHHERLDPLVKRGCWGEGGMLDTLAPDYQFFHDALDFYPRNHHNIGDPHHRFKVYIEGEDSVEETFANLADFLAWTSRPWCHSVVVESNHDRALLRWLKEADYRKDPANAPFFLDCQKRVYQAIIEGDEKYHLFQELLRGYAAELKNVTFLREDSSFRICGNKIECALHGHKGANGARANIAQFAKMGPKANVGHTHAAAIYEGIYQAGTSSLLDMGYNNGGLSSWNHSHIITYRNGKRAIVTMQNGKWRA